jgi:macrolide transport system ATP-binding/permease protein
MHSLFKDIRYAVRGLIKHPGFAAIAVLTLALGIGANTAIFSVVDALLLRSPSGVGNPEQLVLVTWDNTGLGPSYPDYVDYKDHNSTLSGLATFSPSTLHLSTGTEATRVSGSLVSGNYFNVLGVRAVTGRLLSTEDDVASGANPVAVLSQELWRRQFKAPANIVGQTIRLNGYPFTVIGVAASGFNGVETGHNTDVWVPISMAAQADPTLAGARDSRTARGWLRAFGRLKSNVTPEQAQAELSAVALTLAQTYPATNKGVGINVIPSLGLGPGQRREARNFTGLLAAVAGLVLLIACANVANLLLARGQARQKEIAVRSALGATRLRLIRQLLTESLLLAACGGALGAFLAYWLSGPLKNFVAFGRGNYQTLELGLDLNVLGFTLLIAFVTGLVFGLVPAFQAARADLTPVMKQSTPGSAKIKINGILVVGQIAISVVVLIAAGLLVRTLQNAQSVDPGFNVDQVLTASFDLGKQGYNESQGRQFYARVIERVEALPGVRSASLAFTVPLNDKSWNTRVRADNQPPDVSPLAVDYNIVTPSYFRTMEIAFLAGRDFSTSDDSKSPDVVILNETLARQLFPGENPLGRRVVRFIRGEPKFPLEVVGVVKDARYQQLTEQQRPQMYLPSLQQYRPLMTLHVRSSSSGGDVTAAVRREVQTLDSNLPLFDVQLLADQLQASLSPQRSIVVLIGTFGILALALASVGLYGVLAYTVSRRTREIGIRMALGAQSRAVVKLVVVRGMKLAFLGVGVGLVTAFAVTRLLEKMLFGVRPADPLTFMSISIGLLVVALLACWVPARRATRVDPLLALRNE